MMTSEEILRQAIDKAKENGWNPSWLSQEFLSLPPLNGTSKSLREWTNRTIFSHSFAKAFWGEEEHQVEIVRGYHEDVSYWQEHLQQMVLEEEPLKYIERFIDVKVT